MNKFEPVIRRAKKIVASIVDSPALILMYHRVNELDSDPFGLAVSPNNFRKQIEHLKNEYNVVGAEELSHARKKNKRLPSKSVIITFDDGYLDNYTYALPILEHFDAQAIFFVATANIGRSNEFWSDSLGWVFCDTEFLPNHLSIGIGGSEYNFDTSTIHDKSETFRALHPILKQTNPLQREEAMDFIMGWAELSRHGRDSHCFMGSEEVKRLGESRVATIGAHTHNHPQLSSLSKEEQYEEISRSLEILQSITSRPVRHFAYPYGSNSEYDFNSIEICKDLGFELAYGGWGITYRWADDYQLPRINVGDWDINAFKAKMAYLI